MSELEIEPKPEFIRKPNLTEPNAECSDISEVWIEHTT